MITTAHDFSALDAKLDRITAAAKKATRPAAQAGAQIYHDDMRARVSVSKQAHKSGKKVYQPGNLRDAIYQAHVPEESGDGVDKYRVSWNKRKAFYGQFVERGTSKMAAQPFLRPTYDARKDDAAAAARARYSQIVGPELK